MNLHNEIMNINVGTVVADGFPHKLHAYKVGHRDALHAAAELSLKVDSYINSLEESLIRIVQTIEAGSWGHVGDAGQRLIATLRKEAGL